MRWITPEEADRLIACCPPHLAPMVAFMFFTGCRVGEAMALDWRDVDLKRAHAVFLETKNGDRRGTRVYPRVLAALSSLSDRTGGVFRRSNGEPYAEGDSMSGRINEQFKAACDRAGIKDFRPHDCRHTWATWHYAANRDLTALMTLGGWRTVTMVPRYAHVNVSNLAPGVLKLGVAA